MGANDEFSDWQGEDEALVGRLRALEWAPVSPELRQRCWEDFNRRVDERGLAQNGGVSSRSAFNVGERYDFRRFAPGRRLTVAQMGGRRLQSSRRALSLG